MSTILEALKRSERERKLKKLPTLSSMRPPEEQSDMRWLQTGALVLVTAVLAGFIVLWLGGTSGGPVDRPSSVRSETAGLAQQAQPDQVPVPVENEQPSVPRMDVGVISYAAEAERSFAILDGEMVRVGEVLENGLKIEEIHSDRVVASYQGEPIELKP